jgi:hypothetical protein
MHGLHYLPNYESYKFRPNIYWIKVYITTYKKVPKNFICTTQMLFL